MDIPFRPLSEWEEGQHILPNAGENELLFIYSHQRIDLWLNVGGTAFQFSVNPTITCSVDKPTLSADMGVHPIISGEGIKGLRFFAAGNLSGEKVNYRAK